MATSTAEIAEATPVMALSAFGFATNDRSRPSSGSAPNLRKRRTSSRGVVETIDTAGLIVRRLLTVLTAAGGQLTSDQLAFQTAGAAAADIDEAINRMQLTGLVVRSRNGAVTLSNDASAALHPVGISMADQNAITADALAMICRALGLREPARKQQRIDAIVEVFTDRSRLVGVRAELSSGALSLLDRIVQTAGPMPIAPERVGLEPHALTAASPERRRYRQLPLAPPEAALHELMSHGIIGFTEWDPSLWVWKEAWPFVDRPYYSDWPHLDSPSVGRCVATTPAISRIVPTIDRMLTIWQSTPVRVLKNDEPRIGKADAKALAKALCVDVATADLAARLAISTGLVLRNVVSETGRGRQRRVEWAWMPDPLFVEVWTRTPPQQRWLRLLSEWCRPTTPVGEQRLVNRHLVLWELARLADGDGFVDENAWATWFGHRYGPLGVAEAAHECVAELRVLGVVTADGPVGLTTLGRTALDNADDVESVLPPASTRATVQADLTVVAPPGLHHDLAVRLNAIATIESEAEVTVYRLDVDRITQAVHDGDSPEAIMEFLAELSNAPLPDVVTRLVRDGAGRAGQVQLISAATVLVVNDPADLVTACAAKSAKLTAVSATVAVSELPYTKVRAALDRRGLVADVTVGATTTTSARTSADRAAELTRQAATYRQLAQRHSNSALASHIESLEAEATAIADPSRRLRVTGPLTLTPTMLAELDRR